MSTNRECCFVIMPISKTTDEHTEDYWTKHFGSFLKPLIEDCTELEAHCSEALRGDILRQIITDLVTSRVVIADLTDHNANVYWELVVRQSFRHGTITIAQEGTRLPFDISGKGTLFYDPKSHLKMEDFRRRFKAAVQDCLAHPDRPDSHVLETLSGRGTLFEIFRRDEATRGLDAVLSEASRNLELLESLVKQARKNLEARGEQGFSRMPALCLRSLAVELLITNRYVDQEQQFYKLSERYLELIIAINEQLGEWTRSPGNLENWLLRGETEVTKVFKDFKDRVATAREELAERF